MRIKKIIALLVGASLTMSSVVANAAYILHPEYQVVVTESEVTEQSVKDSALSLYVTTEKMTYADAKTANITKAGFTHEAEGINDYYKMVVKAVAPDLFQGYDMEANPAHLQYVNSKFYIHMPQAVRNKVAGSFNGKAWEMAWNTAEIVGGGYALANASTDFIPTASNPDVGEVLTGYEFEFTTYFAITAGTTVENITIDGVSTYDLVYGQTAKAVDSTNFNVVSSTCNGVVVNDNTIDFVPPAPAVTTYPIEMTVTEKEDTNTGYIWALAFGANKDKLASLTATFEDGVREAFVANIPAAAVTAVTGGTTTINVGLKTGATLTGATFVAGNSDVNTEATTQVLYK